MEAIAKDDICHIEQVPFERPSRINDAWRDLSAGLWQSWMWSALAVQDVKLRYRGSVLGPFWLTLSTIIMVAAMGAIYSHLFNVQASTYIPYVAVGLLVWQFILFMFNDGCQTFIASKDIIQQVPIPFSVHVYRVVFRNLLIFAHSAVIIPIGILIFKISLDWRILEAIPAAIVLTINGIWVCIIFGMLSARFLDIPPIVTSFLQVIFFVTPIFWPIESLGRMRYIADLNPIFAAIDVLRAPLLGVPTNSFSWPILMLTTVAGCSIAFIFFARYRARIAYWI